MRKLSLIQVYHADLSLVCWFLGKVDEPLSGTAQVLASLRDRITTTPSIMMNMMTIMIAIY